MDRRFTPLGLYKDNTAIGFAMYGLFLMMITINAYGLIAI